jgi:hypothetical protein
LINFWIFVVLTDIAHELFVEVFDVAEDAAGDHVALDAAEPVLTWLSQDE